MKVNKECEKFFMRKMKEGTIKINRLEEVENTKTGNKIGSVNSGYYKIGLKEKGKRFTILVHRLAWVFFKGEIPENLQINHIDGNKLNNNISNLELVTNGENVKHAYKHGLNKVSDKAKMLSRARFIGEKNNNAHFLDSEVKILREKFKNDEISINEICVKYKIKRRSVKNMLNRKTYSHV